MKKLIKLIYLVFTAFLFASENLEKFDNELNLISKNGNILNQSTITETNRNYGDLNRTRHTELENIAEISSGNILNILADNYTSIAGKTNAQELNIAVKEDVNISSKYKEMKENEKINQINIFSIYCFSFC